MTPAIPEQFAQRILEAAIDTERASELLTTLFEGGSVTITDSGQLIIIPGSALTSLSTDDDGYRECQGCGSEWFEGNPDTPETHRSDCPLVPGGGS